MIKLPLKISGLVIRGKKYGRQIGFPTANLNTKTEKLESGIYAGFVRLGNLDRNYPTAIIIDFAKTIEAHILNFNQNIYDQNIELEITNFIRSYKNFESEEKLISQIKNDLEKVKEVLSL